MKLTFVHTADWQIGKRFGGFSAEAAPVLREERLRAVDRVGEAARAAGATAVLVAGDVFDSETVSDALAGTLLSRLKAYPKLAWHLLPGNHDPARAGGVWEAIIAGGLPGNVSVHVDAETGGAGARRGAAAGAAHRQAHEPGSDRLDERRGDAAPARCASDLPTARCRASAAPARPTCRSTPRARRAPALPIWRSATGTARRASPSASGTPARPSPTAFATTSRGMRSLVRIDGTAAAPQVERIPTAHFTWTERRQPIDGADALKDVEAEVDRLGAAAARHLIALKLEGLVTLAEFALIEQRLAGLAPRLFHLERDLAALQTLAADSDLAAMSSDVLAEVAHRLKALAEGEGEDERASGGALCASCFRSRAASRREVRREDFGAIRLKEVGRFREPVALEGLTGGLNVLAGPNELGKSTILKALKAALFYPGTPRSTAELEALRPYAGGAPLVEVDFEIDGDAVAHPQAVSCRRAQPSSRTCARVTSRAAEMQRRSSSALLAEAGPYCALVGRSGDAARAGRARRERRQRAARRRHRGRGRDVADGGAARDVLALLKTELAELVTSHAPPRPTGRYKAALEERDSLKRQARERRERGSPAPRRGSTSWHGFARRLHASPILRSRRRGRMRRRRRRAPSRRRPRRASAAAKPRRPPRRRRSGSPRSRRRSRASTAR